MMYPSLHITSIKSLTQLTDNFSNAVATCEINLFQPTSTSVWNNFISARGSLPEIISKLFRRLIAAHEYFSSHSLSLK